MSTTDSSRGVAERYTRRVALRHERLYGRGHQGPASEGLFHALAARLDFQSGMRVLDLGSGLGGDTIRLARTFGVHVVGLDAAPDMTAICLERLQDVDAARVSFVTGDVRTSPVLQPDSFDVVWNKDCGLYLSTAEKPEIWMRLRQALRASGQVLITDYCRGRDQSSAAFDGYVTANGQHLITTNEYVAVLDSAGLVDVVADDITDELTSSLLAERERLIADKDGFLTDFTETEYDGLLDRWDKKIAFCGDGELAWTVLTARRPPA